MRKRMAEKRERNKTRGMMINAAQKQAATMDHTKRPTSATAQQLQQELEMTDKEVSHANLGKFIPAFFSVISKCKVSYPLRVTKVCKEDEPVNRPQNAK